MINKQRIKEILGEIRYNIDPEINREITSIAGGGCGFFVYYLGKKLQELNIPFEIRELDEASKGIQDLYTDSTGKKHVATDPQHSASNYFHDILEGDTIPGLPNTNEIGWFHLVVLLENDNQYFLIDGERIRVCNKEEVGALIETNPLHDIFGGVGNVYLGSRVDFDLITKICQRKDAHLWNSNYNKKQNPKLEKIINKLV